MYRDDLGVCREWQMQTLTHRPTFVLHDFHQGNGNSVRDGGLYTFLMTTALVYHQAGHPYSSKAPEA
jgi:hypothetical protein